MLNIYKNYKDENINGVKIISWLGLKGAKGYGMCEIILVSGSKKGILKGKRSTYKKGNYYCPNRFTHTEAVEHWKVANLRKFEMVTN